MSRNLRGLSSRKGLEDSLYENIAGAVPEGRNHPEERLKAIAGEFMTGDAAVLSASSFYDFLQPAHHAKKVYMCDGTACLTSGKSDEAFRSLPPGHTPPSSP